jgi:hypothetical protein
MKGIPILFVSGVVEILTGRKWVPKSFSGVVVSGADDKAIRENFDYSRAFTNKHDAKKARDLQAEGKVRLADYKVEKELGVTTY